MTLIVARVGLAQQGKINDFSWNDVCGALEHWLGHERACKTTLGYDFCGVCWSNSVAFDPTSGASFADEYGLILAGLGALGSFCGGSFSLQTGTAQIAWQSPTGKSVPE